ncbi:MAG TPA: DUF3147 family protein [Candidatus Eisenbacteria bacterium]|jgi:hypothetical protein|nr:DUF3147 family protein [Candidatus Eisenbacteria bacterium]
MRVSLHLSALHQTKWYEYAVRFIFGGTITVLAGIIAKQYGPTLGGLFLAFPAIFPAGATLVEKHERERKRKAGIGQTKRGRQAAALDAYGAALGAAGLLGFGLAVWQLMPAHNLVLVLATGTMAWTIVSILLWRVRRSPWF